MSLRRGAIVIAQTISCMGFKEIGNALLLLNTCQGQLFGFVPEQLGARNAKELRTVFGILCEVVRLAPAEFCFLSMYIKNMTMAQRR